VLPDIVEVARKHGLEIRHRTTTNGDYRANCPFCERNGLTPDRKYHLYLAPADKPGRQNVFHCFRCGEQGGVAKFIALLTGRDEAEVVEEFRRRWWEEHAGQKPRPRHPAESLTEEQIRRTGLMDYRPDWRGWWKANPEATKKVLDALWKEWNRYLRPYRILGFALLLKGIELNDMGWAMNAIEVLMPAQVVKHDVRIDVLEAFSTSPWPEWAIEAARIYQKVERRDQHGSKKYSINHRKYPRKSSRLPAG